MLRIGESTPLLRRTGIRQLGYQMLGSLALELACVLSATAVLALATALGLSLLAPYLQDVHTASIIQPTVLISFLVWLGAISLAAVCSNCNPRQVKLRRVVSDNPLRIMVTLVIWALVWSVYGCGNLFADLFYIELWDCARQAVSARVEPSSNMVVPPIIHRIWMTNPDPDSPYHKMPPAYNESFTTWQAMLPGYSHVLWREADVRHLVQTGYDWLLPTFDSYSLIQKVDTAKLLVLYSYGGLYVDLDIQPRHTVRSEELLEHIDNLRRYPATVAAVDYDLVDATRGSLGNDFLMTAPGHPFISRLLRRLDYHKRWYITWHWTVLFSTGPGLVSSECARAAPMTQRVHVMYNVSTILKNDRSYSWGGCDGSLFGWMVQTALPSVWKVFTGKTAGILNGMSWPDRVLLGAMLWVSAVSWLVWTVACRLELFTLAGTHEDVVVNGKSKSPVV
mmetsp:Transcript_112731/g.283499  ORF Transcript_112731/g.283499 Transcript_112731/m.283499 type:complete len:450 (+) Transcript_112731:65-1414(+)